jgi:hypothetical protein
MVAVVAEVAVMKHHETLVAEIDTMDQPEMLNPMIGQETTIKMDRGR